MGITQAEIKTTAKLLVGVGALAGAPGVGTANTVIGIGTSLMDLYSGRRPETGWEAKVTEALETKLADPEFHRPASADRLLPQLIEFGLPRPEDLTGEGWDADRIARLMRNRVPERSSDPAHANAVLLDAFEVWVISGLAPLLDDPTFVSGQAGQIMREMFARFDTLEAGQDTTHEKLDEILRRMGGGGAVLADPEALSLEELQTLAANFGEADATSKAELVGFIESKRQEHEAFVAEINAINEQTAGLGNLKAAAKAAADSLDYAEVENLLSMVHETELNIAAQTAELRADNALLRGRVEEAFRLLSAAAVSFGSVDTVEPARRAILKFVPKLGRHGKRYGGQGLQLSVELADKYADEKLLSEDEQLWAAGQNAKAIGLQNQGSRTGGAKGAALLSEAVAAYRAALRVRTEADHPAGWATNQNNLGTALRDQGSRTDGEAGAALLAEAVAAYRAALLGWTEADHPVGWATTQNNLGAALQEQGSRTGGEAGAALLGEAVAAYRAALRAYMEADHPVGWAMTQNNLGTALGEQGNRTGAEAGAALLAEAVAAYRAALRVYTEADHPLDWAATQNNLANALRNQGSRTGGTTGAALLGEAVVAYRAALRARTEADHPVGWATTQNNLANALCNQGSRTDGEAGAALLAEAVQAYRAALRVRTEADHPVQFAMTMENIALAEEAIAAHESCDGPAPHLQAALEAVTAALWVYDPEHMSFRFEQATALKTRLEAKLAGLESGSD